MKTLATLAALILLTGCAGFSGKRSVGFELSIMGGNSMKWTSTCEGDYPTQEAREAK